MLKIAYKKVHTIVEKKEVDFHDIFASCHEAAGSGFRDLRNVCGSEIDVFICEHILSVPKYTANLYCICLWFVVQICPVHSVLSSILLCICPGFCPTLTRQGRFVSLLKDIYIYIYI